MGNYFSNEKAQFLGHVVAVVIGFKILRSVARFCVWKVKNQQNKANARKMLEERNAGNFSFESVS